MNSVAIVSHDAGGAEIVSSWLLRSNNQCFVVAEGPAVEIFNRKCVNLESLPLPEVITRCDWVLCGTGWTSSIERQAIKIGKQQGKKTVAFLDHWVNYKERFQEVDGSVILPDEIWVGDEHAQSIAESTFPSVPIKLQPNPYFQDLRSELALLESKRSIKNEVSILYVCEPIREHAYRKYGNNLHWGYTEEDALIFFLKNIECLNLNIVRITIRPHPSENPGKYYWAKVLAPELIVFGGVASLIHEIAEADVVVGCESMAMVVGLLAGKRVISSIPPGGKVCQLPQSAIERMQNIVKKRV